MLGALAFHAVWQKKRESAQSLPLGFTATDELVNDNLCAIGEIAELRFPDRECTRLCGRIAVFKTQNCFFR